MACKGLGLLALSFALVSCLRPPPREGGQPRGPVAPGRVRALLVTSAKLLRPNTSAPNLKADSSDCFVLFSGSSGLEHEFSRTGPWGRSQHLICKDQLSKLIRAVCFALKQPEMKRYMLAHIAAFEFLVKQGVEKIYEVFNIGTSSPLPIKTWLDAIEKAYNVSFGELSSVEQPDETLKHYRS